jgi:hypothetical protein
MFLPQGAFGIVKWPVASVTVLARMGGYRLAQLLHEAPDGKAGRVAETGT